MILFIKLFIAHLIGDFVLQSDRVLHLKELRKERSVYLYVHAVVHGLLAWLIVFELDFWPYALLIGSTHFCIDLAKLYWQNPSRQRTAFFLDQVLHILILASATCLYGSYTMEAGWFWSDQKIVLYAVILLLTLPTSIMIKNLISAWSPSSFKKEAPDSLQNAGKWIGILERLMIFLFIVLGRWEAVGFLLAAKSVFRFGDLKHDNDRKLTEYILIGTLLSFSVAILSGVFYLAAIQYL